MALHFVQKIATLTEKFSLSHASFHDVAPGWNYGGQDG